MRLNHARLNDAGQLAELLKIPFSDQQLAAITAPLEPAVIIAGAGSGKTTVMAARVVWLVGSGQVRPDQVLGLTFTRKAAGELGSRVRRALLSAGIADPDGAEELILTYDAFAARLVAEHGLLLGIEAGLRTITGAARYRLAARAVADAAGPLRYLSRLRPQTVTERVVELSSQMRSHLVTPAGLATHAEVFAAALDAAPKRGGGVEYKAVLDARAAEGERMELAELVVGYEALKAELGFVEFADQMAAAARLATEVPSVGAALRAEFAVVLLDEYQDTSAAQASLLRGLFSGDTPELGLGHPVTAVGDPCQAIYGWRGAAASNILDFAHHFPRSAASAAAGYALTVNRRSGQRVLDAANELAEQVRADPGLVAHGLDLDLVAPDQTPPGRVEAIGYLTWPDEVAALADRAADLHASAAISSWADIAVLCRRNSQVASVYAALTERDIPAEIVGLGGLLELPPIADVVATLTLLAEATANPAAVRLLTSPRWAIGIPDLGLLGRRAKELAQARAESPLPDQSVFLPSSEVAVPSLLEALADPGELAYSPAALVRFAEFTAEIGGLRRHAGEAVTELVARVIGVLGLAVETEVVQAGGSAPLGVFVQAVAGYTDIDAEASLAGLLSWLEAERTYGIGLDQAVVSTTDSVKVLTVHKAKGLEWEVVFLPGLAATVFPTDRVSGNWLRNASALPYPLRGDAAALPQLSAVENSKMTAFAEALTAQQRLSEDRLAYVAVTRARQLLIVSTHTWAASLSRPRQPSHYFQVIGARADQMVLPAEVSDTNPLLIDAGLSDWPAVGATDGFELRRRAADQVVSARAIHAETGQYPQPGGLDLDGGELVSSWRKATDSLLAAHAADRLGRRVGLPDYLSVTGLSQLGRDRQAFEASLRRRMPRLVSDAQRWGIGFHRWLEDRFRAQSALLDSDQEPDLAGAAFEELRSGFEAGPYAAATPLSVETPFTLVLGGQLIRGRIDAVFATADGRAQVVDWKTGNATASDPLQLACYRLAWAELNGLSVDEVDAVFYDLRTAQVVRPGPLPGRAELEVLVAARTS